MSNRKASRLRGVVALSIIVSRSVASGSLISTLANLQTQAKKMDTLQGTFGPGQIGGIYDAHRDIAQDVAIVAGADAIDQIYDEYAPLEACQTNTAIRKRPQPLQKSDIINILLQTDNDLERVTKHTEADAIANASKGFRESCKTFLTCMGEEEVDYKTCANTVNNAYDRYEAQHTKQQEMVTDFYGTQFFTNGTLDDSTYDLMVDMQLIGDLMYGDNKPVTETIYYQMPSITGPIDSLGETPPPTPGGNDIDGSSNPTTSPDSNTGDVIVIGDDTTDDTTTDASNENTNTTDTNTDTAAPTTQPAPGGSYHQTTTGTPLFGTNICIDESAPPIPPAATDTVNPFVDPALTPDEIDTIWNDYMDYINGQYTDYTPYDYTENDTYLPPRLSGETLNIGETLADMDMLDQINACVESCDSSYSGTDALICKASCLCDTIPESSNQAYNRYLDFKIKFCWIPTQVEAPYTSATTVYSVEEIIDNINSTLTALRQSGALHKRNETQEYLDTTLRNMNIADSFVFSFNIAFKGNTNQKDDKIIQQEANQAFAQAVNGSMAYSTHDDKYAFNKTIKQPEEDTPKQETKDSLAAMKNIVDRQTAITTALQSHDEFRRQFEIMMIELQNITANMRVKAENGD